MLIFASERKLQSTVLINIKKLPEKFIISKSSRKISNVWLQVDKRYLKILDKINWTKCILQVKIQKSWKVVRNQFKWLGIFLFRIFWRRWISIMQQQIVTTAAKLVLLISLSIAWHIHIPYLQKRNKIAWENCWHIFSVGFRSIRIQLARKFLRISQQAINFEEEE